MWAAGHIKDGLGGIRLDQLDRTDVASWLDRLAKGGRLARRSIITCRMVLRAVLADAVDKVCCDAARRRGSPCPGR